MPGRLYALLTVLYALQEQIDISQTILKDFKSLILYWIYAPYIIRRKSFRSEQLSLNWAIFFSTLVDTLPACVKQLRDNILFANGELAKSVMNLILLAVVVIVAWNSSTEEVSYFWEAKVSYPDNDLELFRIRYQLTRLL